MSGIDAYLLGKLSVSAASKGHLDVLELLLLEIQGGKSCHTTLGRALNEHAGCHKDTAGFLIHAGADVNALVEELSSEDDDEELESSSEDSLVLKTSNFDVNKDRDRCQWPRTALQACLQVLPERGHDHGRIDS